MRRATSRYSAGPDDMGTRLSLLGGTLLTLAASAWLATLVAGTPAVIVAAAVAPAALYAFLIIWAQRRDARPPSLLIASLLWGITGAAFVSHTLNDLARAWLDVVAGPQARALTATLVAPAIEEAAKASGLGLLRSVRPRSIATIRDGIVYGALIGVGFVVAENLIYLAFAALQGGESGLARSVYLRGLVAGANHAVFTATVGAGIGGVRAAIAPRARVAALSAGIVAALAQHLAWNAIASHVIVGALCGATTPGGACLPTPAAADLFIVVPLVVAAFLGPGAVALLVVYGRDRR